MVRGYPVLHGGAETVLVAIAFAATYVVLGVPSHLGDAVDGREAVLALVAPALYAICLRRSPRDYLRQRGRFGGVLLSATVFFGIFTVLAVLICDGDDAEALVLWWSLCAGVSATVLILVERLVYRETVRLLHAHGRGIRSAVMITDSALLAERFSREAEISGAAVIIGFVGSKDVGPTGIRHLGDFSDLALVIERFSPDFVIFALQNMENSAVIRLVDICSDRCVDAYLLPTASGYFKSERQLEYFGTMPAVNAYATPLDSPFSRLVKRAVDILGAAVLLLLSAPVILVAAVGVKLSSPGPVIFRQTRVGYRGEHFTMLKLRSMVQNDRADTEWSRGTDLRKTRFGNFLRRTSIDELPQLINVLRGEMSLVGPRPEIPKFVEKFKGEIPLYMLKHKVKPGMTGLAQVRGLRGDTSITDRINADLQYIESWSLCLDLSILLQTPFRAINRRERYTAHKKEAKHKDDSDRRRILYVASTASHIDRFHRPYVEAMRARGDEVLLMARGDGVDFDIPFSKRMLSGENFTAWRRVRRVLREHSFDAVILNTSLAAFIVRTALRKKDRPTVINIVHGYLFGKERRTIGPGLMLLAEIILRSRTDTVLVMNGEDREIALRYRLGGRIADIRGMGVAEKSPLTASDRLQRDLCAEDRFVMCFVGELSRRKNQEMLIRAMPRIRRDIPSAVLWLVGEGAERGRLEVLASDLGVSERVTFLGERADACDYMRACDLYVSASRSEGLPFNIAEALSCGKTVLASAVKGHRDIIADGVDGFLFSLDDMTDFVNKTCRIYRGELSVTSEAAMKKYKRYSLESVFPDTLKVIYGALDIGSDTNA